MILTALYYSIGQEITGDVLLELNMNALKELDVPTFGKRFKIQNAINILREEWFSRKSQNRISIASSTLSDIRKKARSTIISPSQLSFATSNCKCTLPNCCYSHRENRSYNNRSNKMRTIHYEEEDEDEDDEDEYLPITPMSPTSHPVPTFYDHPKLFGDKYAKTTIVNSNIPYHEAIATDISKV